MGQEHCLETSPVSHQKETAEKDGEAFKISSDDLQCNQKLDDMFHKISLFS